MKEKQIKKLLKGMIDNLCKTITDPKIVDIIKEKSYITGGCIPSMLLDEYINDFDIYFKDQESANKVLEYYNNVDTSEQEKFKVKLITENAINLSDKIQLIIKFTGHPTIVIEKFDWQHIKSYFIYPDIITFTNDVYKLIVEKELIYTGSDYPLSSMMRLKKYIKKGWNVSNTTILHIALEIAEAFDYSDFNRNSTDTLAMPFEKQFSVEDIIFHLNGVDPLIIQNELMEKKGKYLTIPQIISTMNGE